MNSAAPAVSRILIRSVISLLFACAAGSKAQGNQPVGKDVVYKTVDGKTMHLYVSSPPESISGPHAAIVFFHGGGGTAGAPAQFNRQATSLAALGICRRPAPLPRSSNPC